MAAMTTPRYLIVGAVLALTCKVGAASEITFLDGGYSELCSVVAKQVDKPQPVNITGSRLDVSPLQVCTLAIAEDSFARRLASGNYNNRGVIHFSRGEYEEALRDFREAIRRQPELAVAHVNLGYTYVAQQRWAEAIDPLTLGIALGAEDLPKVYFNRGIAHEETGRIREAYEDYLKASELAPEWEDPKRELTRFNVVKR